MDDCPCIGCVCLAVCRNKKVAKIFNECSIISDYCGDIIEDSTYRKAAKDICFISEMLSEVLNRHFVPCYVEDGSFDTMGITDVDPQHAKPVNRIKIKETYSHFKDFYKIDMLKMKKTRDLLSQILQETPDD